jgi:hypothetical protein
LSFAKCEAAAHGQAIAATLALALAEMPDSSIDITINSLKKEANLAYIVVVNPTGAVIAHTFNGPAPSQDAKELMEGSKIQDTTINGIPYIDLPAWVINGSIVHVGFDPAEGNQRVLEAQKLLLGITFAGLVPLGQHHRPSRRLPRFPRAGPGHRRADAQARLPGAAAEVGAAIAVHSPAV